MSGSWSICVHTDRPEATRALGAALAALARPGDVVLLVGALGVGKTVFAQGFAVGLGVEGPVTSPTFTLVRQYRCGPTAPVRQLVHADLYRLDHLSEVADLALFELLGGDGVALVEWGDVGAPVLGEATLEITLVPEPEEPDRRSVRLVGRGASWAERRAAVAGAVAPR